MSFKSKMLVALSVATMAGFSFANTASTPDFSQIVSGISFTTAIGAIIAVGTALAGMNVAIAGVRGVLRMIK